jgi:hypothetical protein
MSPARSDTAGLSDLGPVVATSAVSFLALPDVVAGII